MGAFKSIRFGVGLSVLGMIPFFSPAHAQPAEPPSVVVIFDGSGSMWGNIEGTRQVKLATARDGLRRALAKLPPQTRLGLASFGHRRGDCSDVEMLVPPEPQSVEKVAASLEKLNPRGRGPLTTALRDAAKALGSGPGRRSLILIHDDADNCQQDVCVAAAELRNARLPVHVVGIALKPEDAAKMACLSRETGGGSSMRRVPSKSPPPSTMPCVSPAPTRAVPRSQRCPIRQPPHVRPHRLSRHRRHR
jgi:Ca-activated chloride channel homolog